MQDQNRRGNAGRAQQEVAESGGGIARSAARQQARPPGHQRRPIPTLSRERLRWCSAILSPRLYVSYGVSLTESINAFKMRYTLNDRWTIKTEAGKEIGADLVYTIEK